MSQPLRGCRSTYAQRDLCVDGSYQPRPGDLETSGLWPLKTRPIENIENVVPTDLEGQQNSGEFMDTQTRQQFSLNVSDNIGGVGSGRRASNADHDQRVGTGPNKAIIGVRSPFWVQSP